uniref:Uncharacterized protein n=1 Tax=Rousettus aegyptiacus TaxID=9407 RepID=A0A7J8H2J7_ROUAE|nr:hypothetical protein HJG63_011315 [Rousettus aegyptiacus]
MAMTEGLLVVILVVCTMRETGPQDNVLCPQRMMCIIRRVQEDIKKGFFGQGRLQLGLKEYFRVIVRAKEGKRKFSRCVWGVAGGIPEQVLGCGVNEEIVQAREHGKWRGCWGRLEGSTGWDD